MKRNPFRMKRSRLNRLLGLNIATVVTVILLWSKTTNPAPVPTLLFYFVLMGIVYFHG